MSSPSSGTSSRCGTQRRWGSDRWGEKLLVLILPKVIFLNCLFFTSASLQKVRQSGVWKMQLETLHFSNHGLRVPCAGVRRLLRYHQRWGVSLFFSRTPVPTEESSDCYSDCVSAVEHLWPRSTRGNTTSPTWTWTPPEAWWSLVEVTALLRSKQSSIADRFHIWNTKKVTKFKLDWIIKSKKKLSGVNTISYLFESNVWCVRSLRFLISFFLTVCTAAMHLRFHTRESKHIFHRSSPWR